MDRETLIERVQREVDRRRAGLEASPADAISEAVRGGVPMSEIALVTGHTDYADALRKTEG